AAHALRQILLRAVLAGQKAGREAEIRDDAETLGDAEIAQLALEARALVKVVMRLQHLVPRQVLARRYRERLAKLRRVVVRAADRLDLAVVEQLLVARQRIFVRGVGIRKVAELEIDRVAPESPQRVLRRLENTLRRQALLV